MKKDDFDFFALSSRNSISALINSFSESSSEVPELTDMLITFGMLSFHLRKRKLIKVVLTHIEAGHVVPYYFRLFFLCHHCPKLSINLTAEYPDNDLCHDCFLIFHPVSNNPLFR